jgi:peptidoglycan hydrolase-like protein with peptidoglycan-binding domain
VRWAIVVAVALTLPAQALAADTVSLVSSHAAVPYGGTVTLTGQATPAVAGETVELLAQGPIATTTTAADGTFAFAIALQSPATFVARIGSVESAPVAVAVTPILEARIEGRRALGARRILSGTLTPAGAGVLTARVAGTTVQLALDAQGAFRRRLPANRSGTFAVVLELAPAAGYEAIARTLSYRVIAPRLGLGSRGIAVRILERRLADLRYALRRVDSYFGYDTYEAVLAFQKVHRVSRTGRVSAGTWRLLNRAGIPRARVARGDHIEVDKTRQVLFEVRRGRVVKVVHVSTGATGNTPVGTWRVYLKTPGTLPSGMYYSLFFLRGFAIHGYPSVPPWPASHGCVRTPMWFAPGLFSRWGRGAVVKVFP